MTHHGALVGLLTMDNVGEFLRIQAVLAGDEGSGRPLRSALALGRR